MIDVKERIEEILQNVESIDPLVLETYYWNRRTSPTINSLISQQ